MKFLCKTCGWFVHHDGYEWKDDMGHYECINGSAHQPVGKGVRNEELRVH